MDVDMLIDAYVRDVTQLLPRKQRNDTALELRELLREELRSRAAACGGELDAKMAVEGLRAFGTPQDVAARYYEPWIIIPAARTRSFGFAALAGALVLLALTPLSDDPSRGDQVALAILAWVGCLVAYFGLWSAVQRRTGAKAWVPRDRDAVNRAGSLALIALIGAGIVAYAAPAWLFAQFTHGHALPTRLAYDATFRATRLPVIFVLWACQAVLLAILAVRGRWNPVLRRVDLGLEAGVTLALTWFVAAGAVFQESVPNKFGLAYLSSFALLLAIDLGFKLYRGLGSVASLPGRAPTSA